MNLQSREGKLLVKSVAWTLVNRLEGKTRDAKVLEMLRLNLSISEDEASELLRAAMELSPITLGSRVEVTYKALTAEG